MRLLIVPFIVTLASCSAGDARIYDLRDASGDDVAPMPPDAAEDREVSRAGGDDAGSTTETRDVGVGDVVEADVSSPTPDMESACPRVRITVPPGVRLNVRPTPSTDQEPVGAVHFGMIVDVLDEVSGQTIEGSTVWYEISAIGIRGFISGTYAECTRDEATMLVAPEGFYLPLECDESARISQGNNGSFSHSGVSRYAWDFAIPLGTPLVAIADGLVLHTYAGTLPGSECDGGGQSCVLYANHVVLLHGDDTTSTYRHLSRVDVEIGEFVPRGVAVGLSGQTGWSTGPHAHVMRMENCGSKFPPEEGVCQSIPTSFADVTVNGGVPTTGDTVTSGNCIPLRD